MAATWAGHRHGLRAGNNVERIEDVAQIDQHSTRDGPETLAGCARLAGTVTGGNLTNDACRARGTARGRAVIDFETGGPMPLYVPMWWDNRQTKAPGFYVDPVLRSLRGCIHSGFGSAGVRFKSGDRGVMGLNQSSGVCLNLTWSGPGLR